MNIEEYGRIVCAALLHKEAIYMAKEGHYAIFTMEEKGVLRNAIQGFVTENGYFVDRTLGLMIANYYNQIQEKHPPEDQLLSEDLKEKGQLLREKEEYTYRLKRDYKKE